MGRKFDFSTLLLFRGTAIIKFDGAFESWIKSLRKAAGWAALFHTKNYFKAKVLRANKSFYA